MEDSAKDNCGNIAFLALCSFISADDSSTVISPELYLTWHLLTKYLLIF